MVEDGKRHDNLTNSREKNRLIVIDYVSQLAGSSALAPNHVAWCIVPRRSSSLKLGLWADDEVCLAVLRRSVEFDCM